MDISDGIEISCKKCYKCEHKLYDNLKVTYDESTSIIILWNKFQIFVYEDRNLASVAKTIIPEFQIHNLIFSNNYIFCLDIHSNVYTTSMKFKTSVQKRFKSCFQLRKEGIAAISYFNQDLMLCLQKEDSKYFISFYTLNAGFHFIKSMPIDVPGRWPISNHILDKCILGSYSITEGQFNSLKIYNYSQNIIPKDCRIILVSFDNLTIYSSLFSADTSYENVPFVKLHVCPSEICNMEIVYRDKLFVLITLKMGVLMTLNLEGRAEEPDIIYMNTAIYKCLRQKESIIYTDGVTMWMSINIYSKENITFRQFIVRHVKDFAKCGELIVCTTYSNLIYVMSLDDDTCFVKTNTCEYTPAQKLLNNSQYLYKILEEIERNKNLIKSVESEGNYITSLALTNRQDLMNDVIQHSVVVYDSYVEAISENKGLVLTDDIQEYCRDGALMLLVKLTTTTLQHMFANMITNLLNDLRIHVTLLSDYNVIKTTSLRLKGSLRKINILISLNNKEYDIFELNVIIKIVLKIPGAHDPKQVIWCPLYQKEVHLHSEHFIKTTTQNAYLHMKEPAESIDSIIYKIAHNHHRELFKIVDTSKNKSETLQWSMYLKIPHNYKKLLRDSSYSKNNFSSSRAKFLIEQYTMVDFLYMKRELCFNIGKAKVKIELVNDMPVSPAILKVTSENIKIAFNIRNFFSHLIYNDFKNHSQSEYVSYNLYYVTEDFRKSLKSCVMDNFVLERFHTLADKFQRCVFGVLPF